LISQITEIASFFKTINIKTMKFNTIILLLFVFAIHVSPLSAQTWDEGNGTLSQDSDKEITWNKTTVNLGEVEFGSATTVEYELTNVSDKPILITNAQASCGCTNIEYPRRPIAPKETIKLSVVFEADDIGVFNKTVTLTMNIQESRQTLYIKGVVTD
jgi:hypothetical protein